MKVLGLVMIIAGILLGLYVGVYLCFFRGVVIVVEQIRADVLNIVILAWGITRVVLASLAGWLSSLLLIIPGYTLMKD